MSDDTSSTITAPEPGVYLDVPMARYLALLYASASGLEKIRRSPLQYQHARSHPKPPTDALDRGTALHLAVLEPLLFDGRYITIGRCEGKKKDGERCQYQGSIYRDGSSYCGTHDPAKGEPMDPGITVMAEDGYAKVLGMRDAILGHPRAASLFEGQGLFEVTIIFVDPETGVLVKVRPDRLVERAGMMVDIKTTRDAFPQAFSRDAENRGYFRKLALYRRALRAIGWPYKMTAVLAIESEAPHDLIPFLVQESDLDSCERDVSRLLRIYSDCMADGKWPGYAAEFQALSRPPWAKDRDEEILTITEPAVAA